MGLVLSSGFWCAQEASLAHLPEAAGVVPTSLTFLFP